MTTIDHDDDDDDGNDNDNYTNININKLDESLDKLLVANGAIYIILWRIQPDHDRMSAYYFIKNVHHSTQNTIDHCQNFTGLAV